MLEQLRPVLKCTHQLSVGDGTLVGLVHLFVLQDLCRT